MNAEAKPPKSWKELHAIATASGSGFPRQLTVLAEFALRHPDGMAFGTCSSIARRAGVSATTVSRLANVLGYPSFREFRKVFRDDLARTDRAAPQCDGARTAALHAAHPRQQS